MFKKSYRALWIGAFWCCAQIIEVSGDGWRFAFGAPVKFLLSWHWAGVDVAINLFAVITLFCIGYGLRTLHRLVPASKASH
ncbi:hypothetical protein [Neiella holothuriorum]|uniref:hypothetical protein n=1 Tax=Neiella holothuriorum TaxID=2870530 RepID=UPI001C66FD3B|nr:hypothetical protein [Neiella holothuriorum]